MSFGVKSFLVLFVELFLVGIIILYGVSDLNKIKNNYQELYNDELIKKEMRETMNFDGYNKTLVSGAEVYHAITYYRGSDVGVCIVENGNEIFYNKKIQNGEYVLGALQEDDDYDINKINALVDFNKTYKAELVRHKNDFVAMIKFSEL